LWDVRSIRLPLFRQTEQAIAGQVQKNISDLASFPPLIAIVGVFMVIGCLRFDHTVSP
jgi:hypothetical protein